MASNPQINANLRRAIRRNGFLDVLAQMIGEIKHYDISIDELKKTAENKYAQICRKTYKIAS